MGDNKLLASLVSGSAIPVKKSGVSGFPSGNGGNGGSRGVFGGGEVGGGYSDLMDFITIQSEGDAETFGDLSDGARRQLAGFADSTRGCFGGGYNLSLIHI